MSSTTLSPGRPQGLDESYEYYENNFTSYDHPEGVFPKYLYVMRPGLAFLYNGLPERTDYNDSYLLGVALTSILLSVIELFVQSFCLWTLKKNSQVSDLVKLFLFINVGIRINADILNFYQAQCLFNWSCVDPTGYPSSWLLLNQVWSNIAASESYLCNLLALGLSFNRYASVFYGGSSYQTVKELTIPYICLVFLAVEAFHISLIGKATNVVGTTFYVGYFFSPNILGTIINGFRSALVYHLIDYFCYVGYLVVGVSLLCDVLTFLKIRQMVFATHFFNAMNVLYFQVNTILYASSTEPFTMFLANIPGFLFPIVNGLIVAAFSYPEKERKKDDRVFNQRVDPTRISQVDEMQMTTIT